MHRCAASIEPIKAWRRFIPHKFASYELGTLLAGECAGIIVMLAPVRAKTEAGRSTHFSSSFCCYCGASFSCCCYCYCDRLHATRQSCEHTGSFCLTLQVLQVRAALKIHTRYTHKVCLCTQVDARLKLALATTLPREQPYKR